jgi:hypothetical protein
VTIATATPATVAVAVKATPKHKELSNAGRAAAKALRVAREAKKAAEAAIKEAEATIRAELDGATAGTVGGLPVVRVVPGSNSHFDRDTLSTAYPEAYEAALRVTTYDSLRLA